MPKKTTSKKAKPASKPKSASAKKAAVRKSSPKSVSGKTASKTGSKTAAKPAAGRKQTPPGVSSATPLPGKTPKGLKAARKPQLDHETQKRLLDHHRKEHHQDAALEVAPRPKLQAYTLEVLKQYLNRPGNKNLNLWKPESERKAREKASAAKTQAHKPNKVGVASVADLLGFNPARKGSDFVDESKLVPERFRRYYRLLVAMRTQLEKGLAFHTEEALKKSGKDDAGDLSGYSQHLADAGTDTADRDFALSLISNEQEALKEIAEAIERMKNGTYGVCEVSGKPIPAKRLEAVPFTRFSLEGQKELERTRRAHRRRGQNPLGEAGDEVGFGTGGGGGEDEPADT
ncbi:MAG: TraR/DksA family transcriptional regulator [Opitutales bacterium]